MLPIFLGHSPEHAKAVELKELHYQGGQRTGEIGAGDACLAFAS